MSLNLNIPRIAPPGKATEADLDRLIAARTARRPYIPLGCDQQGRYATGTRDPLRRDPNYHPAAEAATHLCLEPDADVWTPATWRDTVAFWFWVSVGLVALCYAIGSYPWK